MPGIRVSCAEPKNEGGILPSRSRIPPRASSKSKRIVRFRAPHWHRVWEAQEAQMDCKGTLETRCYRP